MLTPCPLHAPRRANALPARWRALRTAYQAHLTALVSHPMTPALFDLSVEFPDTDALPALLAQLDDIKQCLDSFRPFNPAQLTNLQRAWDIEYTYDSNKIEGNTLSLQETALVVNEGLTIGGKRLDEHLEAINHQEAIDYIRDLATGQCELNEYNLNAIHALILRGIDQQHAGRYRTVPVVILGSKHTPPQPFLVPKLMEDLLLFYGNEKHALHPVQLAAEMHLRLVTIHPYVDGNGRTSRLLMNLILLQHGYPIANISSEQRNDYFHALEAAHLSGDASEFHRLVARTEKAALFRYLHIVSGNIGTDAEGKGQYFFERIQDYL